MTTPLSPAAQAVMDAYGNELMRPGPLIRDRHPLAAAFLAVADQVVPEQPTIPNGDLTEQTYRWDERSGIRAEILAIAAELAAILRERHGGSSTTADWLDGVGCHQ